MNRLDLHRTEDRLLGSVLRRQADEIPEAPFLLVGEDRHAYGAVNAAANAYANGLAALGVSRGDTVGVLMASSPEFVFAAFGANKLGAVWVPTNTDYKGVWLREALADSRARVLFVDAELLPRVAAVAEGLPLERLIVRGGERPETGDLPVGLEVIPIAELAASATTEPGRPGIGYGDTAAVLWTSGTTGRAKGVMQSHNAWIRGAESGARTSGVREGDILYSCLPMYNSAAWVANIYRALVTGIPVGLDAHFSPSAFWDRCRHYRATMTFTLGAMHIFLWQREPRADDADNPVRVASMIPIPDALIEPVRERFGIESIHQGFGQSEVMGLLARVDDGTRKWKPGSLGEPLPGLEVKLLDDEDREVGPAEVGEFCARPTSPYTLFNGYFGRPDATVEAFRNLWYHTGDLGRRDEDGEFFFVDRKADTIRYKGRNVSSLEIETAVGAHPAVAEVAAHGVVSAELESEAEIKVVVVLRPGEELSAEQLAVFVNETAPYFFVPRYIEFAPALPHTPTGRVQKYRLRERGVTEATWDRDKAGFRVKR